MEMVDVVGSVLQDLSHLVSREWIWTAIAKADDFRKVKFFKNDKFDRVMDKNRIMSCLDTTIEGYKRQDRKAGRETNDENHIDAEWCLKRMRNNCQKCGKAFELGTKQGKLCSNFTAQRIDNALSHTVDDCSAWCLYCNCSAH